MRLRRGLAQSVSRSAITTVRQAVPLYQVKSRDFSDQLSQFIGAAPAVVQTTCELIPQTDTARRIRRAVVESIQAMFGAQYPIVHWDPEREKITLTDEEKAAVIENAKRAFISAASIEVGGPNKDLQIDIDGRIVVMPTTYVCDTYLST